MDNNSNIYNIVNLPFYHYKSTPITVRINIDKTNYQYVNQLLDKFITDSIHDKIFVSFAPIVNWGGNDAGKDGLPQSEYAKMEIEWMLKCFDNNIQVSGVLPVRKYKTCMAENVDSEVFDVYGNVYSCWEFPYTKRYGNKKNQIGNLQNDYDTFRPNATLRKWADGILNTSLVCKECVFFPACAGGCPKAWHEDTAACFTFKYNYKDRLILDFYFRQQNKNK